MNLKSMIVQAISKNLAERTKHLTLYLTIRYVRKRKQRKNENAWVEVGKTCGSCVCRH